MSASNAGELPEPPRECTILAVCCDRYGSTDGTHPAHVISFLRVCKKEALLVPMAHLFRDIGMNQESSNYHLVVALGWRWLSVTVNRFYDNQPGRPAILLPHESIPDGSGHSRLAS